MTVANDEIYEKYLQKAITESNTLGDELAQAAGGARVPVLGSGHPLADVFLLKYSPQAAELQEGVAFYGSPATRSSSRCSVCTSTRWRSTGRTASSSPGVTRRRSRPFLLRELHIVQPKLVVAMGEPAVAFLNAVRFPLARELDAWSRVSSRSSRPTIQGLVTPTTSTSRSTSSRRRRRSGTP